MGSQKEKTVTVIILNYINYEETYVCVQSVLGQNYKNYNIVIVENGSNNCSYQYLKKRLASYEKVTVLRAGKNYGFAKGNNIGICFAKRKFGSEYILLLNSDTMMEDCDYIRKMVEADTRGIGVIGSKIINSDRKESYGMYRYVTFPATLVYYLRIICKYKKHPLYQVLVERLLEKCKGVTVAEGSALLLTPDYFRYYGYLDPRTFLYCEEELLYIRCKRKGLDMMVNDRALLFHKYRQSSQFPQTYDNEVFYKRLISSYKFVVWESIKMYIQLFGKI